MMEIGLLMYDKTNMKDLVPNKTGGTDQKESANVYNIINRKIK